MVEMSEKCGFPHSDSRVNQKKIYLDVVIMHIHTFGLFLDIESISKVTYFQLSNELPCPKFGLQRAPADTRAKIRPHIVTLTIGGLNSPIDGEKGGKKSLIQVRLTQQQTVKLLSHFGQRGDNLSFSIFLIFCPRQETISHSQSGPGTLSRHKYRDQRIYNSRNNEKARFKKLR